MLTATSKLQVLGDGIFLSGIAEVSVLSMLVGVSEFSSSITMI